MTIKLFVADDSVTIQKIVTLAFSGEDVQIQTVSDGNSVLEKVRAFRPDVVLADVFMPGCSGYDVCEQIKEDSELGGIPVVLLVGTFEPFDESEASRVKCDGFLTKPFDTSELIRTVHELVGKKNVQPTAVRSVVSSAALESFLGKSRVLDIIDPTCISVVPAPAVTSAAISEDQINLIVDRVVRRMSSEVIREVAWEVVPELSESIIRSTVEESKN